MPLPWPGPVDYGTCERCGRKMQFCWSTLRGLRPAEIDPDACEACGEDVVEACLDYEDQNPQVQS